MGAELQLADAQRRNRDASKIVGALKGYIVGR